MFSSLYAPPNAIEFSPFATASAPIAIEPSPDATGPDLSNKVPLSVNLPYPNAMVCVSFVVAPAPTASEFVASFSVTPPSIATELAPLVTEPNPTASEFVAVLAVSPPNNAIE